MRHESGSVTVNGARLAYDIQGDGHPLVLIHAGIADRRQWDDQMDAFAARYTVIRYDQRGWGDSSAPAGPVAFHEDLYGLLRALNIAQAHILGISMAGTMAIDFALTHPDMVSSLVLVGSWLSGYPTVPSDAEKAVWERYQAALDEGRLDCANKVEVDLKLAGIHRDPTQVDPAVRERLLAIHRPAFDRLAERDRMTPWLKPEPPAASRLAELHAPTLVIYGDLDVPVIPVIAAKLAAEIRGARTIVMPGTAHVPNMEQPQQFNHIVLDFLASLP
ncbi:MAG: hypothetical protein OJF49_002465 [Ktedonobacterales bacterium]|jgi:pimeloyl-ACP methyl ester carboxylesterase|nr:MAG: hypothetical protein OJF49_002465 [Ktedonobacterales bacterium]